MSSYQSQIEALLLFKNEPVSLKELAKLLETTREQVELDVRALQEFYSTRGMVLVSDGEHVSLGTHPDQAELIERVQKDEFSKELGRAGLETLALVLYKGPISRKEIDYIRGVNSTFILRNLLIRGLVERVDSESGERSFSYKPSLKLLEHLGITRKEDLPDFESSYAKVGEYLETNQQSDGTNE